MVGWIEQWYLNVPAVVNVWLNVLPGETVLLSNDASSAVTVWPVLSAFVQVTFVPTATDRLLGPNAKFWIVTASPPPAAAEAPLDAASDAAALGAAALAAAEAAALGAAALAAAVAAVDEPEPELPHAARASTARRAAIARTGRGMVRVGIRSLQHTGVGRAGLARDTRAVRHRIARMRPAASGCMDEPPVDGARHPLDTH